MWSIYPKGYIIAHVNMVCQCQRKGYSDKRDTGSTSTSGGMSHLYHTIPAVCHTTSQMTGGTVSHAMSHCVTMTDKVSSREALDCHDIKRGNHSNHQHTSIITHSPTPSITIPRKTYTWLLFFSTTKLKVLVTIHGILFGDIVMSAEEPQLR